MNKRHGFTLVEVMIASAMLTLGILGILGILAHSLSLPESSKEKAVALHAAEMEMEEICARDYLTIRDGDAGAGLPAYTYEGALLETSFDPIGEDDNYNGVLDAGEDRNGNGLLDSNFAGSGTIYANELFDAESGILRIGLMRVKVVVCYPQKDRIIGEDKNLNGQLDYELGEDVNGNGELDSPSQLETIMVNENL